MDSGDPKTTDGSSHPPLGAGHSGDLLCSLGWALIHLFCQRALPYLPAGRLCLSSSCSSEFCVFTAVELHGLNLVQPWEKRVLQLVSWLVRPANSPGSHTQVWSRMSAGTWSQVCVRSWHAVSSCLSQGLGIHLLGPGNIACGTDGS